MHHVVAVAAVIVRAGRVLAMQRARKSEAGAGLWETLSGRVEAGEEPLDAVRREIVEECGLEVDVETRPLDVYAAERNGAPMIVIVYRAAHRGGEVVRSHEHDDHAWLSPEDFRERTSLIRLADSVDLAFRT